jgi:hypothetical protein
VLLSIASCSSSGTTNGNSADAGIDSAGSDNGGSGDGASSNACDQGCARALAAKCANYTAADCMFNCQNPYPSCQTEFDNAAACAATATFMCVGGYAAPQGCDAQQSAWVLCLYRAATTQPNPFDGGSKLGLSPR